MIFLHCGWPKTGTSSLQHALVRHRERLYSAGLLYPEQWCNAGEHNSMVRLLGRSLRSGDPFEEMTEFLDAEVGTDIMFSAESLTGWLLDGNRREVLAQFLEAMQEASPVTCIWTLRRLDELACSWCMHAAARKGELLLPAELLEFRASELIIGMSMVADTAADTVFLKYDGAGSHSAELLRKCGVPGEIVTEIDRDLRTAARRNTGFSYKQAVATLNLDALSERAGVKLSRRALVREVYRGNLHFDDDRPWRLGSEYAKMGVRLHEEMLAYSLRVGFEPYARFFANAPISGDGHSRPEDDLSPEAFTDRDLERLVRLAS